MPVGYLGCKRKAEKRAAKLMLTDSEKELQRASFKAAACDGKKPFSNYMDAQKSASKHPDGSRPGKLWAYKCNFCRNYHVGTTVKMGRPEAELELE